VLTAVAVLWLHWLPVQAAAAGAVTDGEYVFAEHNPFLGDPAAYEKGKDLFKRGLLSEAALALEAEVGVAPNPFCPDGTWLHAASAAHV
jgi:hypothetical protein